MRELQERFIEKITAEYEEFRTGLYRLTYDEIMDKAQRIADMKYYYEAFKDHDVVPTPEQLKFLMTFERPLETLADKLASVDLCGLHDDISYCLWEMEDRRDVEGDPASETEEMAGVEP